FAQGARQYLDAEAQIPLTGDSLVDLKAGMRFFVTFCTQDPVRYQLMFQRTIPGFEPSPETFALSIEGLDRLKTRLERIGLGDQRSVDLLTALGTGLTDQQLSNDPGGDRWTRLVDDAMEMYFNHLTKPIATKPIATKRAGNKSGATNNGGAKPKNRRRTKP
ncbi:MAG: Transcriptional regulator, TetR family, partial [Acidimicrobiia bacterium]|nr:Transcriptional regulator, TetR family [Acidimicrobiia bacterium]